MRILRCGFCLEMGAVHEMFNVDDALVATRTAVEADALVELVSGMFAIRALGELEDFLGVQVDRDRQPAPSASAKRTKRW
jgi:hypothetical protein